MLKKILSMMCLVLILTGCHKEYPGGYIPYINEMGPGEIECNSFYHYIRVGDGLNKSGLQRYDLITETDQDIYLASDPHKQEVSSFYGDDNEVYFVVTTHEKGSDESTLYCYDLKSDTCETLFSSEEYLYVCMDSLANKVLLIAHTQDYYIENRNLQEVDPSSVVRSSIGYHECIVRQVDANGTLIEISKEFNGSEFTYKVADTTGVITALSDCGGEEAGLSDYFTIEGDKVIGIVQITKEGMYGIIPCNYIRGGELKKELLVSLDYKTGESEILYNSKNNTIRIIGYSNGKAYLYKKDKVIRRNLSDGSEEEIYSLSYDGNGQLSFNWIGSKLIIFDEDNQQVVANIQT